jgi:hypothetical protein
MRSCTPGNLLRGPLGALIALLGCLLVAPSNVQAGCSRSVAHTSGYERLIELVRSGPEDSSGPFRGASPTSDPLRRRPCSGPSCSEGPQSPTAPSVEIPRYVEPWAYLGFALATPRLGSSPRELVVDDLQPLLGITAIFHPPRP